MGWWLLSFLSWDGRRGLWGDAVVRRRLGDSLDFDDVHQKSNVIANKLLCRVANHGSDISLNASTMITEHLA